MSASLESEIVTHQRSGDGAGVELALEAALGSCVIWRQLKPAVGVARK